MKKLLELAIENFAEVEQILQKIDFEPSRKYWHNWAMDEHIRLLKKNKSIFNRVQTIQSLLDEKMKAQSLIFAMGIANILNTIQESETQYYVNLKITKKDGKITVETQKEGVER